MDYKLSKITQAQLDKLPKTELGKSILANYDELKGFTDGFTVEYDALKEQDEAIYQNIMDAISIEDKKEVKPKADPKAKATTKPTPTVKTTTRVRSGSKSTTKTRTTKKQPTKVEYVKQPDVVDISWKQKMEVKDLHQFGKVYELEVVEGTCPKIGVVLSAGVSIFIKGNTTVKARKNELIEFVCTDKEKGKYQQFNIIGNIKDKCIFKYQLFKNGSRKEMDCKTGKPKKEAKAKKEPCPPTPCDDKKETTKRKPQQYKSERAQGQALAELTYLYGSDAKIGNADQIITKIMRRKDNRIVLQMNDFKYTRSGAKAVSGTEQYFLFQEKDRKLLKSEMPKEYTLVDAKKEVLKQGEEAKSNLLDKIYSKKEEVELCYAVEKEMLKCKEGACDASEKAYYQGLLKECSEKAGKQQFFKDLEKQFLRVFNGQKRGESFWQAYNRMKPKSTEKQAKTA